MLFNSYVFLFLFLPVTWGLFRLASRFRATGAALSALLAASLVFYSYWNPPFVLLILFSTAFNYALGRIIERRASADQGGRAALYLGVGVNLALIAYFKYANFFMENLALLCGRDWVPRDIFLPLGISFFTFQQIAYLIDCSRGTTRGCSFRDYALFITFFPQLIAGPIVRYDEIVPQFRRLRTFALSYRNLAMGLTLLSFGLFKKLVIADTLSPWVSEVFDADGAPAFFAAWGAVLGYAFQIYFDFSGYSDMALGLGRMFNIELPVNFNSPYKARSVADFWRRWHMTLSSFLRDYLYIPLGGNRKGELRRHVNLMTTMLLGGLWHGASWNFVVWGGLHGLYLCVNHAIAAIRPGSPQPGAGGVVSTRLSNLLGWSSTFFSVLVAWVFFRAETFGRAVEVLRGMFGLNGGLYAAGGLAVDRVLVLSACLLLATAAPSSHEWTFGKFRNGEFNGRWALAVGLILLVGTCFMNRVSEFLYFQF